jgi:hypothetical protein
VRRDGGLAAQFVAAARGGAKALERDAVGGTLIKELVRRSMLLMVEEVTRRVLGMHTTGEVRGYLTSKVQEVRPRAALVDAGL